MPLFDAYLFIDWSSTNQLGPANPTSDAIWVGELTRPGHATEDYCRGRDQATELVRGRLRAHCEEGRRVLVGFDFPYGYPAGLPRSLGLGGEAPWRALWEMLGDRIVDSASNVSNRFEVASALNERIGAGPGPFWGCPKKEVTDHLKQRMNGFHSYPHVAGAVSLKKFRRTELAMNKLPKVGRVQATWQLAGAGSVGSQALVGIPRVLSLRDDEILRPVSAVWPFETGFTAKPAPDEGPYVLHAEIWPGIVDADALKAEMAAPGVIKDQAQVRLMCRWAAERDDDATLGAWFDATAQAGSDLRAAVEEEGWILGCPA
jgi:hypothetical protein